MVPSPIKIVKDKNGVLSLTRDIQKECPNCHNEILVDIEVRNTVFLSRTSGLTPIQCYKKLRLDAEIEELYDAEIINEDEVRKFRKYRK